MPRLFEICATGDPAEAALGAARDALTAGGIALLPAEGLYGLHGLGTSSEVQARIRTLKGRTHRRPFILLVATPEQARELTRELPGAAGELMRAAWPGPLTLVLPASSQVPTSLTEEGRVAVRCPATGFLRKLLSRLSAPLISTSANRAGEDAPASVAEVAAPIRAACAVIVDGGRLAGVGSSLVRPEPDGSLTLLRAGLWEPGAWSARLRSD